MKHTPGPWDWFVREDGVIYLATPNRGRLIVMDFGRKGMRGAQPRFAHWDGIANGAERMKFGGIMEDGIKVGQKIHPDAQLIAAAPDLFDALLGVIRVADRKTDEFDAARAALSKAGYQADGGSEHGA